MESTQLGKPTQSKQQAQSEHPESLQADDDTNTQRIGKSADEIFKELGQKEVTSPPVTPQA